MLLWAHPAGSEKQPQSTWGPVTVLKVLKHPKALDMLIVEILEIN